MRFATEGITVSRCVSIKFCPPSASVAALAPRGHDARPFFRAAVGPTVAAALAVDDDDGGGGGCCVPNVGDDDGWLVHDHGADR